MQKMETVSYTHLDVYKRQQGKKALFGKGRFALQNVDFELPSGYIMGIIGENGAGKTTFFRSIMAVSYTHLDVYKRQDEYNEIMFLREITHTINAFNEMADVVRLYSCLLYTSEPWCLQIYGIALLMDQDQNKRKVVWALKMLKSHRSHP